MKIDRCIETIDKYLSADNVQPLLVNVQNPNDLNKLISHFSVDSKNLIIATSEFCKNDELPNLELMLERVANEEANSFIIELSSFIKLVGEDFVVHQLSNILNMNIKGHVVFILYQCEEQLTLKDPRIKQRVVCVSGDLEPKPTIVFTNDKAIIPVDTEYVNGINKLANCIENTKNKRIYVLTQKTKQMYEHSLLSIANLNDTFSLICQKDIVFSTLSKDFGTDEQWKYLFSLTQGKASFKELVDSHFGNYLRLEIQMPNFKNFTDDEKWLYFISLKIFGAKNNSCLNKAAFMSNNSKELIRQIFRSIVDVAHTDMRYNEIYCERKLLLNHLGNPADEVSDYCKYIKIKEVDAIRYLTDNTVQEKELIFYFLDKYSDILSKNEIEQILKYVYPDLFDYLQPYRFNIELLESYFPLYNYCKVINKVLPEIDEMVRKQSVARDFARLLQPRSSKLDSIDFSNSQLYFIDAMGSEYISFILSKCKEMKLNAKVNICHSNLPSITCFNKEFLQDFENKNLPVFSIKELDEIKHDGVNKFDYTKTKLPLHLIHELEVIENILSRINIQLENDNCHKAILVSDHGASRLAVLHETETIWEMSSKGVHSGRCCPKSDMDVKTEYIMSSNEHWVLANYDRFKGGRKANVEVHGGATLEEVVIPIIELSKNTLEVEISVIDKEIFVSFKKKAAIKLFSKTHLPNLSIRVGDNYFEAKLIENNIYLVEMPQIKKSDTYIFDVYSDDIVVASGLSFTVKKESSQENDIL